MVAQPVVKDVHDIIAAVLNCELPSRPLWFRGQRNANWSLEPSIQRLASSVDNERSVAQYFRTRAGTRHAKTPSFEDRPAWLSLMQHYRLPTRLLDWSRSPLIAAYFAVAGSHPKTAAADAAIWVLAPHTFNQQVAGIAYTPSIQSGVCRKLVSGAFFDASHLQPGDGTLDAEAMAVMAFETDIRMFVQQGAFSVHEWGPPLERHAASRSFLQKLIVPAAAISGLRTQIEACGVFEGDIFPDLEHLAAELQPYLH